MTEPRLYRGPWPQNVSKLAKYAVKFDQGTWRITVLYEAGEGLQYLAVEHEPSGLAERVNAVKQAASLQLGGPFYVNEYRHVIVPVAAPAGLGTGSVYCYAGKLDSDLTFQFEGQPLTSRPIAATGEPLAPGDRWVGPRPGIPYVLAAGGGDIYYKTPALSDSDPPTVRPGMTHQIKLSATIRDKARLASAVRPIVSVRGHSGGRFYVNEHQAIFTPVGSGDGNGIDYIYCGQIDLSTWFREPPVP
jgi:hypothetical protein